MKELLDLVMVAYGRVRRPIYRLAERLLPSTWSRKARALGFGPGPFREELGERLLYLREEILKVDKPSMAKFLGLKAVSRLEEFESGKKEMPRRLLEKLATGLMVSPDYLDRGGSEVFAPFPLHGDKIGRLLDEGFEPVLLGAPRGAPRRNLLLALYKTGGPIPAVAVSDRTSSFESFGGGRDNIRTIIGEMKARKIDACIPCYGLSHEEWRLLETCGFYDRRIAEGGRPVDWEMRDSFEERYREESAALMAMASDPNP